MSLDMLPNDARALLLPIARSAIVSALGGKASVRGLLPDWLCDNAACFVSLHKRELRGCRGTVIAYRPLIDDLTANARPPSKCPYSRRWSPSCSKDEDHPISRLRPGIDGVILDWHGCRSAFLPQGHDLPDLREFVQLKNKAGLRDDFWAGDLQLCRYTVSNWSETDLRESRLHV